MSPDPPAAAPSADLPALSVRWDGLVVSIDSTTLNTLVRKSLRKVSEIEAVFIEPEDGRLAIKVEIRKVVRVPLRGVLTGLRFKDGLLGFRLTDVSIFGIRPIPTGLIGWVFRKVVRTPGQAFYYPEDRVIVINLSSMVPPELSVQIQDVVCEGGEVRFVFGPSHYRLDRLIEEIGKDPFEGE